MLNKDTSPLTGIIVFSRVQGCQLPDFSLRFQSSCYTADFSTTFIYICLKPRHFCTSHHRTTSKHSRIQEFWLYFAKKFCDPRQKREKSPHLAGSSCAWAGPWPRVTCTLSTSRSFQTFLKHNFGNPTLVIYEILNTQSFDLPKTLPTTFICKYYNILKN